MYETINPKKLPATHSAKAAKRSMTGPVKKSEPLQLAQASHGSIQNTIQHTDTFTHPPSQFNHREGQISNEKSQISWYLFAQYPNNPKGVGLANFLRPLPSVGAAEA